MVRQALQGFLSRRLSRGEYLGLHLTVGCVLVLVLLGLFGLLAHAVGGESPLLSIDKAVAEKCQDHRQEFPGLRSAFLIVTEFGSIQSLTVLTILVAVALLLVRRRLLAVVWVVALIATSFFNTTLKEAIGRERPDLRDPAVQVSNASFPSGHSMGSMCGYGLLAYFALLTSWRSWLRGALLVLLSGLILAIGASRIYLGVHYLSDVVAGFAIGGAWVGTCVSGVEVLRRRAVARDSSSSDPRGEKPDAANRSGIAS